MSTVRLNLKYTTCIDKMKEVVNSLTSSGFSRQLDILDIP